MSNVHKLKPLTIPPSTVVDALAEDIAHIEQLYVIAFIDGHPVAYASGDLKNLALASVALQDLALKYLNGDIEST